MHARLRTNENYDASPGPTCNVAVEFLARHICIPQKHAHAEVTHAASRKSNCLTACAVSPWRILFDSLLAPSDVESLSAGDYRRCHTSQICDKL